MQTCKEGARDGDTVMLSTTILTAGMTGSATITCPGRRTSTS